MGFQRIGSFAGSSLHKLCHGSCSLCKGDTEAALPYAELFIQDEGLQQEATQLAIELCSRLAAGGQAEATLAMLENSAKAAKQLEPLVVALKQYLGRKVRTTREIREIAADIITGIEGYKEDMATARA